MHGREIMFSEREKIEFRLKCRWSIRRIGRLLKRNHGVVQREITRNRKPEGVYSAVYAEAQAEKRRVRRGNVKRKLDKDERLREHVIFELKRGQAPDVIAGRMKLAPPPHLKGVTISTEAIYLWLYEGEGHKELYWKYLPTKRGRRKKRGTRNKQRKTCIPERISIHARDEGIDERLTLGHWESDSVNYASSGGQRLSVQTERKARFVQIHRLPSGKAPDTTDAIRESIASLPQDVWKTITFDNGGEASEHQKLRHDYNIETYFCDPYASWQKGTVEQTNGLIRRHLPRGTDLRTITDKEIYDIQEQLNNTPRKILNYRTPREVLFDLLPEVVH
jgi:IS30 family transposase